VYVLFNLIEAMELQVCIRKIFGSNLGRENDYTEILLVFSQFLQENLGIPFSSASISL
jgi:hypothetical protein